MKTKIHQFLAKLVPIAVLLMLISSTSSAHAPEYHFVPENQVPVQFRESRSECRNLTANNWANNGVRVLSQACDPINRPDISNGITQDQFPNGLCFPSFNNYTDLINRDGTGRDPFRTPGALFGNEKNFLKIAKDDGGNLTFTDDATVAPGERVQVVMYIHNDGDTCLNDNVFSAGIVSVDDFPDNWRTTSHNTRVDFKPGFRLVDGVPQIVINQSTVFNAGIQSDDAVGENNQVGSKTTDGVTVNLANGTDSLTLKYVPGSAKYIDFNDAEGEEWSQDVHDIPDPNRMFTGAMPLPTLQNGEVKAGGGDYYASEPYIGLISFDLEAEEEEIPNICTSFETSEISQASTVLTDDRTFTAIRVDELTFTREVPEEAMIRWSSDNPDGEFFDREGLPNDNALGQGEVRTSSNIGTIFYKGQGGDTITAEVIPDELDLASICENPVTISAPVVCREITVDSHQPIVEGFVSRMTASSVDQNGDPYTAGDIRFTVDDGYGTFSETRPASPPLSSAPYVLGSELRQAQRAFSATHPSWMSSVFEITGGFDAENWGRVYERNSNQDEIQYQPSTGGLRLPEGADPRSQFNFGQNSVLGANSFFNPAGKTPATAVRKTPPQSPYVNFAAPEPNRQILSTSISEREIIADTGETVNLTANRGSSGQDVVHVEQLDADGLPIPACSADFPIEPLVCEAIDVNISTIDGEILAPNDQMNSNNIYLVEASSTFGPIDERARTNITYTIDPQYGAFVNLHPILTNVREAQVTGTDFDLASLRAFIQSFGVDPNTVILPNTIERANPSNIAVITLGETPEANNQNFIQITTSDRGENEAACSENIGIIVDLREPVCIGEEFITTTRHYPDNQEVNQVESNQIYRMSTVNAFAVSVPDEDKIQYVVDPRYGRFLKINQVPVGIRGVLLNAINLLQNDPSRNFDENTLANVLRFANLDPNQLLDFEVETDPGEEIILITFNDGPAELHELVTISQKGIEFGKDCWNDIDQLPVPLCESLDYSVGADIAPESLARNSIKDITARSNFRNGIAPANNTITYQIDPAYGTLIDSRGLSRAIKNAEIRGEDLTRDFISQILVNTGLTPENSLHSTLTVESGTSFWVLIYADGPAIAGQDILTIVTDGFENQCFANIDTPEIPGAFCTALDVNIRNSQDQAVAEPDRGQFYTINSNPTFAANGGAPENSEITYTINDQYGTFITYFPASQRIKDLFNRGAIELTREQVVTSLNQIGIDDSELSASVTVPAGTNVYLVTYSNSPNAAAVGLEVSVVGFEEDCATSFDFDEVIIEENLACIELKTRIFKIVGAEQLNVQPILEPTNTIERNSIYQVSGKSTFVDRIRPDQDDVTYNIDQRYGSIINPASQIVTNPNARALFFRQVAILQDQRMLDRNSLLAIINNIVPNENNVLIGSLVTGSGNTVHIITYTTAPLDGSILTIRQNGDPNVIDNLEQCVAEVPIPADTICIDLALAPRGGEFNPETEQTIFDITGQFQGHNGNIVVTLNGQGSLSLLGADIIADQKTITFTEDLVQSSNSLTLVYHKAPNYDPSQAVTISVAATRDPNLPAGVCTAQITSVVVPPPPTPPLECVSLDITRPAGQWRVDVTGDNQLFQIEVRTNPAARTNTLYYNWEVTRGQGEWERNQQGTLHRLGELEQVLRRFDDNTRVRVWASRDAAGNDIFRNANGDQICIDTISATGADRPNPPPPRETPPEIEKVVYPGNDLARANKLINIGDKTKEPYLTFMAIFTPGSSTDSVRIQDEALTTGGDIISTGGLGGHLDLRGFEIIAIDSLSRHSGEVLYRSVGYRPDNTNDRLSDRYYNYDSSEDYDCAARGNRICIENIETAFPDFRSGREIGFDNVSDLGSKGRIVIKYQMANESRITSASCKDLTVADGCGERFKNIIQYRAFSERTFRGTQEIGRDRAEAVVLCPFVLTRQGGDVLFHDIINSGADVAKCSPVKSSTGVGIKITPIRETPDIITRSGSGTLQGVKTLSKPTHDICKFSNESDNLENYNDALRNFSSTVCELKAEVAQDLYETNINAAIRANITRIARWGENLRGNSINSAADLQVDNKESGVFVKTSGPLTIGENGTYTIAKDRINNIPAAQTYIVIGHDLIINSDIVATAPDYNGNQRNIAYASFIVINGNIVIDKDVKQLDGIYMAINLEKDGKIVSNGESTTRLKVNGSMIGDVYDLFKSRVAVGDPRFDQGAVTIQYDERILLNTPPGIGELIDIRQAIVPN